MDEELKKVEKLYEYCEFCHESFSCSRCKEVLKIPTCKNCPIYVSSFSND